jgi:sugar phosphate isomerase/epimerase
MISASSGTQDLYLSAMTLRYASFADRVLAAAAAGFTGIGMGVVDWLDARRADFSEAQLLDYVRRHGLQVTELEFLKDWWAEADVRGVRLEEDLVFYLAGALDVPQINAGLFADVPDDSVVAGFRRLCARAADHGVRVALEFMPYSALPTLAHAQRVIAESGATNAGLMLDAWHWQRSGGNLDETLALDPAQVFGVQLCDAQAQPHADLRHEGRHLRVLPGHGAADLAGFIGAVRSIGVTEPFAVEVLSDELDARHPVQAARLAAEAAHEVLTRVPATT